MWSSVWVRGAVSVAILAYLASRIDMGAALDALLQVDLRSLSVVLLLVGVDRIVMITRWLVVLRSSGHDTPVKSVAWIFLVSSFIGSALPASIGGDAARAYTLARRTDDASEAVASVAVDRLFGILSLAMLAGIGASLWRTPLDLPVGLIQLVAVLMVGTGACLFWSDRWARSLVPERWHGTRPGAALFDLADALARYRRRGTALRSVLALSVLVQLLRISQAYLLGVGLGIDVSFAYYLLFMPIGLLMLLLPVSVAGFGLPQGVIVWLLRPQGIADSVSFALSTLIVLTGLAGNLPGAWLYARRKER